MDRNQVRYNLLKIMMLALGLCSWVFFSFVFSTRPEETGVDALSSFVRLPASLPAKLQPTTKTLPAVQMDVMVVPCWDKRDDVARGTSSRWVRLTGKACQTISSGVTVRNLTNGYTATVFTPKPDAMTTDFIPLQAGANDILIRFETEPGVQVESQFKVNRQ